MYDRYQSAAGISMHRQITESKPRRGAPELFSARQRDGLHTNADPFVRMALSCQKQKNLLRCGMLDSAAVPRDMHERFFAHYITNKSVLQYFTFRDSGNPRSNFPCNKPFCRV